MKLFIFLYFLKCFIICLSTLYEDKRFLYKRHLHWYWNGGRRFYSYPYWRCPGRWYPYITINRTNVKIGPCLDNKCPDGYTCFKNECYINALFERAVNRYNLYLYNSGRCIFLK